MNKSPLKMTRVALESLLKKPATVPYPAVRKPVYAGTRGRIAIDEATCILCVLCDKKCPTGAIKVDRAAKTWAIDRLRCIQCNYCVEVCPKKSLVMENLYSEPVTSKQLVVVAVPYTPPPPKPPAPKPAVSPPADGAAAPGAA
jgi:formate hydrogenlyase subunit 6/NADH:ubiquinone oxidoreductase subunit I